MCFYPAAKYVCIIIIIYFSSEQEVILITRQKVITIRVIIFTFFK